MLSKDEEAAVSLAMRQGQREAVEAVSRYLAVDHFGSSFLAVLPTGAGKSGLIATICQSHSSGPILVLSPRAAVCSQLAADISGKFFAERGVAVDSLREVDSLDGELKSDCVYVATFQKLIRMDPVRFEALSKSCSLLIVDEGHSEPAPLWGKAVRIFGCHKVIVTATPYRNDLFQFDIGIDSTYCYTFKNAIEHEVIELPEFLQCEISDEIACISDFLIDNPAAKVIVKTKSLSDLLLIKQRINEAGLKSLAIHQRLKDDPVAGTFSSVPIGLKDMDVQVVIHQRKLDEGVDLPSAKMCVLTYPVASGRELVQTVGRVVRKYKGIKPVIVDCSSSSNAKLWKNYLDFDSYISTPIGWNKFVKSLDTARLIESYLDTFPDYTYLGSSFREKFDLSGLDVDQDIKIPTASVCFLAVEDGFTIESFADAMLWRLHQSGELSRSYDSAYGFKVITSIKFESSKYLKSKLLFEPSLEIIVAKRIGNYLAIFDSRSINHAEDSALGTKQPVASERLFNLSARGKYTRVKETHAKSISTSRKRPERVSHVGPELTPAFSGQSAASYALSVARVDNIDLSNRVESSYYLSAGSGRIADQRSSSFSLNKLSDWLDEVASVLDEDAAPLGPVIGAFALPIDPGAVSGPLSLTIDFTDLPPGAQVGRGAKFGALDSSFLFQECSEWSVNIGGAILNFEYSEDQRKIVFSSSRPVELVLPGEPTKPLVDDMNRRSVKILFAEGISYVDGKFYKSALPTAAGLRLASTVIGSSFYPIPELQNPALSEKGRMEKEEYVETSAVNFDPDSVFHLIDNIAHGRDPKFSSVQYGIISKLVPDIDLVICTDMGTEAADFVISSPKALCFVHVKCGKSLRPNSPAGALAEVGSQAIKNIEYLVSSDESLAFGNELRIAQPWPSMGSVKRLNHRLRFIAKDGVERSIPTTPKAYSKRLIQAIQTIKERRRSLGCRKEVWIVAANSFSYKSFEREMSKGANAKAESLQAYQLLDAWLAVASANDIELRLMVSP